MASIKQAEVVRKRYGHLFRVLPEVIGMMTGFAAHDTYIVLVVKNRSDADLLSNLLNPEVEGVRIKIEVSLRSYRS